MPTDSVASVTGGSTGILTSIAAAFGDRSAEPVIASRTAETPEVGAAQVGCEWRACGDRKPEASDSVADGLLVDDGDRDVSTTAGVRSHPTLVCLEGGRRARTDR